MAFWSWRKWPDLLVDFGQQLYIPWQLAGGKLLYRDIVILHGPLSQYFNAFWFKLFGPSLTVLIFVNLAILAGITVVLYKSVRRFADSLTATAVCLVLLTLFGFSQYVRVGNYNYVTPYTHEATHGIALTAAMILALSHYLTRGGHLSAAISGICLGLALLTKVEVALAAVAVVLIGFVDALASWGLERLTERDELVLSAGWHWRLHWGSTFISSPIFRRAGATLGRSGILRPFGRGDKNVFTCVFWGLTNPVTI